MKDKPVILVVDDQPQNIALLEANLVPLGYEIIKAANGEEALGKLSGNGIDLILLDVMMPGMDGFEVTRRVRQDAAHRQLPIILVTALQEAEYRVKGIEAGCDDFLSKPVDRVELIARVRSLLKVKAFNDLKDNYRKNLESEVTGRTEELKRALESLQLDITRRKQAEDALFIKTMLLEAQSESSIDAILALDNEGRSLLCNKRFGELWKVPRHVLDKNNESRMLEYVLRQLKDPEEFSRKVAYFYEHRDEKSREEIESVDGRCLDRYSSPLLGVDGQYLGRIWFFRDVTERKLADEVLRQTQQQQLLTRDQFLSRMSHELRSPLTPIHQFVTILLDGLAGGLNAEQLDYLQIILRNVNSLRTMINDLLEVTRAESGKLNIDIRCVYLTELIPQILKTFQLTKTKDLHLSFDVPDNLPPACADPDRVRQILDNLLDNAIKFTPDKGKISVKARISKRTPEFLCVEVTDSGPGIARSEHKKIFDYQYQVENKIETGHRGLGIGLYICKELVSSHGGQIRVKSRLKHGSTFSFTLPVFSLERQLAAVVNASDLITHSIALITVELSRNEKRPPKKNPDQEALRNAWNVLQSCTLPNLIVLLPRVAHSGSKEFFFMVACVNQSSAKVLVKQLQNQLARYRSLQDFGLKPKVSFILLDTRSKKNGIPEKKIANRKIIDSVGILIKKTLHNKGGLFEWTKSSHR